MGWTVSADSKLNDFTKDVAGIELEKGDTVTLNYQELADCSNKLLPKGGHVEWYWGYYGGKADFTLSSDKKNCTVFATRAGLFVLGCEVYDATGNEISSDTMTFSVSSPFYRFINIVTLGLFGSLRLAFWRSMGTMTLLPLYDIN